MPFHRPDGDPGGPEADRDLGVALAGELAESGKIDPAAYRALALSLLDRAVARDPEDWEAAEARAAAIRDASIIR